MSKMTNKVTITMEQYQELQWCASMLKVILCAPSGEREAVADAIIRSIQQDGDKR